MRFFPMIRRLPIQRKLHLIILSTSILGLLLAGSAFLINERLLLRTNLVQDLTALARLVATNSEAALLFDDPRLASDNLAALHVKSAVSEAYLLDEQGRVFASFPAGRIGPRYSFSTMAVPSYRFDANRLLMVEPVVGNAGRLGTVCIQANLKELNDIWRRNLVASGLILLSAGLAAFFLSSHLQRLVSQPVLEMTRTVREVAQNMDTSVRVKIRSEDELGELGRTFNAMLETIGVQNRELHDINRDLEKRVIERTSELQKAWEAAESADRLKSAFLATMSHELRTPLNSIIGFTGILLQELVGSLNPEQKKQLGMVRNSSSHLLDLINDVLDISKIEAGQLQVAHELIDLKAIVEKTIQGVQPLAQKKGLDLVCEVPVDLPPLLSDRRRVEQILMNLLSNAIKFTEVGRVHLSVFHSESAIRIAVTDTGIGLSPEDITHLFIPFSQIDTGLTRKYEGTGLGLSICKRLTELLGGQIWVDSALGQGSTFIVQLPGPEMNS
jgi:signal transduction histidine kinase